MCHHFFSLLQNKDKHICIKLLKNWGNCACPLGLCANRALLSSPLEPRGGPSLSLFSPEPGREGTAPISNHQDCLFG